MDLNRIKDFKTELLYANGINVGGTISSYKPPRPTNFRKGTRVIHGYTYFQNNSTSDCIIDFTIAFNIKGRTEAETEENISKFLKFRNKYSERFIFIDEFGVIYKGYLQNKYDIVTPVEGDIYYIGLELLCNHDVSGWVKDNDKV